MEDVEMNDQSPVEECSENGIDKVIGHPLDEADDDIAFIHELGEKIRQIADEQATKQQKQDDKNFYDLNLNDDHDASQKEPIDHDINQRDKPNSASSAMDQEINSADIENNQRNQKDQDVEMSQYNEEIN